jgi:hypothetical protein
MMGAPPRSSAKRARQKVLLVDGHQHAMCASPIALGLFFGEGTTPLEWASVRWRVVGRYFCRPTRRLLTVAPSRAAKLELAFQWTGNREKAKASAARITRRKSLGPSC